VKKMSEKSKRKMNRAQLMAKKGYQKLNFDTNIKKQDLPAVVVNNLSAYLEKGLLQQTRRGYYRKPQNFGLEDRGVETHSAQDEEVEPSWVTAAKDAVAEEPVEEPKNSVWDEAKLATGQKAVNIVQLVDGLLTGELGLSALTQIKQEAVLILDDFGLIQRAEESS
tara:strand:- start:1701 stop:2198 length:498 start_codon:yes stop_codon:yes gene_type:complete